METQKRVFNYDKNQAIINLPVALVKENGLLWQLFFLIELKGQANSISWLIQNQQTLGGELIEKKITLLFLYHFLECL
ncbi:hypothetical protein MHB48_09120 [Psychrobacillus sp. FSL H8-0483]|uniref:hypothetical protein n=1 Tax=Psychrobacillus sp. FSL H8-0483 TaxID=2921389 RepID=UPI00315A789E